MNPSYFGDSYDIVKRFFCTELATLGYTVVARPMFTGTWNGTEQRFLRFIGATEQADASRASHQTALFFDPDTGVRAKSSRKHASFDELAQGTENHALAFAFDQSFSRQPESAAIAMRQKIQAMQELGHHAMYYDSHARFLFVSKDEEVLKKLRCHLETSGIPSTRFVT